MQCLPVHKAWDPLDREKFRRLNVYVLVVVIGAFNLFTDIILLLLPVPVVLRLHTNRKRKVGLILLFSLGALGTALTAVRLWKTVVVTQLRHRRAVGLRRFAALALERLMLVLLAGVETAIIPICANGPALAACWRTGGRCQRANAPAAYQPPTTRRNQPQPQQAGVADNGSPAKERGANGELAVTSYFRAGWGAAVIALTKPRVSDSAKSLWKSGPDSGEGSGGSSSSDSLSSKRPWEKLSVTLGPSFEEMTMPGPREQDSGEV